MTWVTWRQYRVEMIIALAILGSLAAFLLPSGIDKLAEFRNGGIEACLGVNTDHCSQLRDRFINDYNSLSSIVGWFNFAPAVFGLLLAAPMVGEFEQRTYRLAWTQSVTRNRWLLTKLGLAIAGALVLCLILTALMTWWYVPLDKLEADHGHLRQSFSFEGIMPLAYTLFAMALTLVAGALSRRTIVAVLAGLVGFTILRLTVETLLRAQGTVEGRAGQGVGPPGARDFWTYQGIEAACFIIPAILFIAITVRLVRRRMS